MSPVDLAACTPLGIRRLLAKLCRPKRDTPSAVGPLPATAFAQPSINPPIAPPSTLSPHPPQGHMVPMDQPQAALTMITRFARGQGLADAGAWDAAPDGGAATTAGAAPQPSR